MLTTIIWIIIILLVLAFKDYLIQAAAFIGVFMGIGALIGWLVFDAGETGATVGFLFAIFVGLRLVLQSMGAEYAHMLEYAYYIFSIPFIFLNRLQHTFSEPWRYICKTDRLSDGTKDWLRPMLNFLRILLYIALTPLRAFNAIIYNGLYAVTELYDLCFELVQPSSYEEGAYDGWLGWLLYLPLRLLKYPIWNGMLTIIEAVVWTVIDIFLPAVTMYHGTDLTAGQSITGKKPLYSSRSGTVGTFAASQSSWGGIGVYFASLRSVAKRYATDSYRLDDSNPIIIVCRVSLGSIINYALAPSYVYRNAGQNGRPSVLNNYAEKNGYTTGEWWNGRGGYWEYCMFDWQNAYNHPWRIRPIYVFNLRTGKAQRIEGGMRRWLFDKMVLENIWISIQKHPIRFTICVILVLLIIFWLWQIISSYDYIDFLDCYYYFYFKYFF